MDAIQSPGRTATVVPSPDSNSPKLQKAAREFEAQLLAELLRHMQFNAGVLPGSDSSGANEQYHNMATQAVAEAMAAGGGIGIAKSISSQLHQVNNGSTR
jgi:Rod binding domain-containing protein